MSKHWTADEVAFLRRCADQGLSSRLTARDLDRTQAAVWQMAGKLGVVFHGGKGGAPLGNQNRRLGAERKRMATSD